MQQNKRPLDAGVAISERKLQRTHLERKTKGLLNRLSESNLEPILIEIQGLFRSYPRHDTSEVLTREILEAISNQIGLLESFVVLYVAVVYVTGHVVGPDLVAYFTTRLVQRLMSGKDSKLSGDEERSKVCMNMVISPLLIYDLVRELIQHIEDEFHVELLLKLLKNSGHQLRQDDPASLKNIILQMNERSNGIRDECKGSRYRFMIEMLDDLKNNKKKLVKGDSELAARWKKSLSGILARRGIAKIEPLRIRLADLAGSKREEEEGETHRKWLLAGYARAKLVEAAPDQGFGKREKRAESPASILLAAAEQHMNTDVRKLIFSVLMTSEDYLDAIERLNRLRLKPKQSREMARVAMHCCGQEKAYNPYYGLVANALVVSDRGFRRTFVYCLWDVLKQITSQPGQAAASDVRRLSNLARFFAFLIAHNALTFCCLKAAAFDKLDTVPTLDLFLTVLISRSLLDVQKEKYLIAGFGRIARMKEYSTLKEGLVFYFGRSKGHAKMLGLDADAGAALRHKVAQAMDLLQKTGMSDDHREEHNGSDSSQSDSVGCGSDGGL